MDIHPIKNQCQSNPPFTPVLIPDELIAEILSFLSVKTIARFKCVNKSWNNLISNPTFTQMHLKKSLQNPHFILTSTWNHPVKHVISLPVHRLLENESVIVAGDTCHNLKKESWQVVGSCNGLLCLLFNSFLREHTRYRFCLWNPTTRTMSDEIGGFWDYRSLVGHFKFSFGCDYLTGTYKVVALYTERNKEKEIENEGLWRSKVKVFSLGDVCWRKIQSFPLVPLIWNDGVHLSGTVNWLAIHGDYDAISDGEIVQASIPHVEQFVIASLDLSTETYNRLLLPKGFNEVPCVEPSLRVLMDCLCFSHDFKRTEFVIWQMKEFGIQESWTQLFRFEYVNLQMHNLPIYDDWDLLGYMTCDTPLLPLYLSKNGDTLILTNDEDKRVIIYNRRDKRVERIGISNKINWFSAIDYVESLVSTHWKSGDMDEEEDEEGNEEEDVEEEEEEEEGHLL